MYKVLLVDDEKMTVEAIENFLIKHGFEVFTAFNGEQAKKKIQENKPDIILLDIVMPKMDGFEVLDWVRKNIQGRIPVIIISVKNKLDDIKKGYTCDVDFYLPKPFSNQELLRSIKTVLSLSSFRVS